MNQSFLTQASERFLDAARFDSMALLGHLGQVSILQHILFTVMAGVRESNPIYVSTFKALAHFPVELITLLWLSCKGSLRILDTHNLIRYMDCKYFLSLSVPFVILLCP